VSALGGRAFDVPDGTRGFDCNSVVGASDAAALVAHGYDFAIRYIRRETVHAYDLNRTEANRLLDAGLGVMCVQHVERDAAPWWIPTGDKGLAQGLVAVTELVQLGFPIGTMCWLDLEGVARSIPAGDVIEFCQQWYHVVKKAEYEPGIYIGYRCGLTPVELYYRLSFRHYWGAGNLNTDEYPAIRGIQMKQKWRKPADVPSGVKVDFNVDVVRADAKGGRPRVFARGDWFDSLDSGSHTEERT